MAMALGFASSRTPWIVDLPASPGTSTVLAPALSTPQNQVSPGSELSCRMATRSPAPMPLLPRNAATRSERSSSSPKVTRSPPASAPEKIAAGLSGNFFASARSQS